MLGQPKCTKVKGLDKEKIRLENLNQFVSNKMVDAIHKKLTRVEVA